MSKAFSPKSGWTTVAFGDVVKKVTDKVDPEESGLERYVAGQHMYTDELRIRRWGEIGDDYLGPAFHMRFKPGQVLYGSRRTYLRKVALADFEGITANTTYVLESKDPEILLPELLPFLMQAETFHEHSKRESKGSVNPYVNFSDLAWYEFALPPLEEQRRIAELLQAADRPAYGLRLQLKCLRKVRQSLRAEQFPISTSDPDELPHHWKSIGDIADFSRGLTYKGDQASDTQSDGSIGCIGIPCITPSERIDQSKAVFVTGVSEDQFCKRQILKGATLIVGSNGNPNRIGDCVYVPEELSQTFGGFLLQATTSSEEIRPEYLFHLLSSPALQAAVSAEASGSTGLRNLNLTHLKRFRFPLPSLDNQGAFVAKASCIHESIMSTERRILEYEILKKLALKKSLRVRK